MKYTIGQIADEFGLTLRTLRFYEQRGLIAPVRTGEKQRDRLYSDQDKAKIRGIMEATRLGFSLREVKDIVQDDGSFNLTAQQISKQIRHLSEERSNIESAIASLGAIYDQRAAA